MRYKTTVSYDGTAYNGWQIQPSGITVQKVIQDALAKLTQQEITVTAAGRTDAGVHSYGQVFHFDCDRYFRDIATSINSQLPDDIHVISCEEVSNDFHSRFAAKWKCYRYLINTGSYDPLMRNHAYQLNARLDVERMKKAAEVFIGEHDFTSFNATKKTEIEDQVRTVYRIDVTEDGETVCLEFYGDGFLRHMIRMMVGTLIEVGKGNLQIEEVRNMLEVCDKNAVHYNAPACGLYLMKISYDNYK